MIEFLITFLGGLSIIIFMLRYHKHLIRIEWDKVASFVGFLMFMSCLRLCIASFYTEFMNIDVPYNQGVVTGQNWLLGLVFYEDAFFAISIFLFRKYISNKKLYWITFTSIISLWFATGHLYQGYVVALLTALYPFFVSHRLGLKYGFGTVMVCHILYDHITVYLIKILPFLGY